MKSWIAYKITFSLSLFIYPSYHTKMPGLHSECYRGITRLIEHPVMIKPPGELSRPVQVPIMLTKRERKKLRKQRR